MKPKSLFAPFLISLTLASSTVVPAFARDDGPVTRGEDTAFETGAPVAVLRNLLKRTMSNELSASEKSLDGKIYYTQSLNKVIDTAPKSRLRSFDADEVTGTQEPESLELISLSATTLKNKNSIVHAVFKVSDSIPLLKVDYAMKFEGTMWKVDDITYFDGGRQSLRQLLRKNQ